MSTPPTASSGAEHQLLVRVARAIWVLEYREANPDATAAEAGAAWKALPEKPLGPARTMLRLLEQAGLDVSFAGTDAPAG